MSGSGDLRGMVLSTLEQAGFETWSAEDVGLWLRAEGDVVLVGWRAEGLLSATAALHRESGRDLERMRKALYTAAATTLRAAGLVITDQGEVLRVTAADCAQHGAAACEGAMPPAAVLRAQGT
jgi:pimeloyl-ACP methyl ester carboxylesterase